eukprot:CAMPEP_0175087226 /NCGR_PEP_ID=MMETSP0052_2-20121109/29714_1 /TAXON_ID=51329 ORGANISM="Polytomella parva, Strain SAG 63-3" /NCGR_SAMPLE_ID=MMETSP0052_2 /ASSEMBLY_ACC=CAM_ASM_000194 /LENGTH=127 /DNA_ID=CAMNT_0016359551 /DNA_START=108 /DNA_END=487 /DNA_ORIENTATION=-
MTTPPSNLKDDMGKSAATADVGVGVGVGVGGATNVNADPANSRIPNPRPNNPSHLANNPYDSIVSVRVVRQSLNRVLSRPDEGGGDGVRASSVQRPLTRGLGAGVGAHDRTTMSGSSTTMSGSTTTG